MCGVSERAIAVNRYNSVGDEVLLDDTDMRRVRRVKKLYARR